MTYTGELRRGAEAGTAEGELRDELGARIVFTGHRRPDGSYALTGSLGEMPGWLRVPLLDDTT